MLTRLVSCNRLAVRSLRRPCFRMAGFSSVDSKEEMTEEASTGAAEEIPEKKMIEVEHELWEAKQNEATEFKEKWMRSIAEHENIRKRAMNEIDSVKKYAAQSFAKDVLSVVDNLEMALKATESSGAIELMHSESDESKALKALFEGLQLTHKEILHVLGNHQVTKINAMDTKFDPNLHEALFEIPNAEKEIGTIAAVVKEGYMFKDRVLRPSKVGTTKKP